jgi:hypothetical protein
MYIYIYIYILRSIYIYMYIYVYIYIYIYIYTYIYIYISAGPGQHLSPEEFHRILITHINAHNPPKEDLDNSSKPHQEDSFLDVDNSSKPHQIDVVAPSSSSNYDDGKSRNTGDESTGDDHSRSGRLEQDSYNEEKIKNDLVLIDVRNYYETRIGRFELKKDDANVLSVIDPKTRQFSDFAKYVDANVDNFLGKKVLMYCTGINIHMWRIFYWKPYVVILFK